ncbi:phage tail tape measure protein [Streptomyces sp. NPDC006193]|uniref:phage tail tape measure protein n=1 Tax=Streptomyces sp. NPDC006193 TaxID=3155717 RepID=UPI0033B3B9C9
MALTVGELNAIMTVDDRAVDPALRRAEQAMRQAGDRIGQDATQAGQQAGQDLGEGFVRGADGQWRNMRGELVDAVRAAALEAEAVAHRGGQQAGQALGDGLTDGAADGGDDAATAAESGLSRLKTAALGIGAAAGALLMNAAAQAMEQSQITGRLGAQLGKTPAEAQRYGKIAGQLYADAVTEDFQGAADAISAVMRAGIAPPGATNAQLKSIATNVSDLSSTFELDLGQTANAVGQMIKTGLAKDGREAVDALTAGLQKMGPRADDIADTFNEYSTIFRQMGIDATQATGLLSQGMKAGARDTDVVADSLKEFVLITQGGGKEVNAAFKKIGLSGKEMQSAFSKGGPGAAKALDKVFDRLRAVKDPADRAQLALTLFGTKAEDTQKALFALDPSQATDALGKVGGAADRMGDSLRNNAGAKVEQFKRGLQQGVVDFLGTTVIPGFMRFYGFLRDHEGEVKAAAAVVGAVLVPVLATLGVQALIAGGRMAAAWVMALGPIGWVGLAIGALVVLVIAYWDRIKAGTVAAWSWIVGKVRSAKDGVIAAVGLLGAVPGMVSGYFGRAKDYAVAKLSALLAWLRGLPGRASAAVAGLGSAVTARASAAWTSFKAASVARALSMVAWVRGLPGRISSGLGSLGGLLVSKGVAVVQGLWSGIRSMGGWIRSQLIGWAKAMIPGPIAKALGIHSPSKVTKAQGRWIARGLIDGLTGSSKQVRSAATRLADIVSDSMRRGARKSRALKLISSDTKKLARLASQRDRVGTRIKAAQKKLDSLIKDRDKLAADVKKGVLDDANITKQDTGGGPQTAASILIGLKESQAAAAQFAKNLATLRKKGVRADLIAQIAQAGVAQGGSAAAALATAGAGQIKEINSTQAALVKAAGQAGASAGDAMYGAGIHAAQGLVKGLKSQQKAIEKQMLSIARSMSKAIRRALGIKSPSRVMAQVGAYTAEGLRQGIEGGRTAVNRSMASLVETPAPGSWDMASGRARAAASQRVVLELRSSGQAEDDYMIERMRRGIRKKGGGDVDLVLAGRRSG